MLTTKDARRFWSKVDKKTGGRCWQWKTGKDRYGYGQFWHNGKNRLSHRIALLLARGEDIPSGQVIRHQCHNPACCNPFHMLTGAPADNSHDMVKSDRQAKGEANGQAKLKAADKVLIFGWRLAGVAQKEIASRLGIASTTVSVILREKQWQHASPIATDGWCVSQTSWQNVS